jgi:diguanylate cyclase (GGDEF)-like protein
VCLTDLSAGTILKNRGRRVERLKSGTTPERAQIPCAVTQGVSVKRVLTSWVALALVLLVVCSAAGLALRSLQRQVENRAQRGAIDTAQIVAALVAHRNVDAADFKEGALTAAERSDMDADVAELFDQGHVVGVEVWLPDGELLYADKRHPRGEVRLPDAELARSRLNKPWVSVSPRSARRVRTLDVFLPYDSGTDGINDGMVEVLLPELPIADAVSRTTRDLNALALVVVLAAIGSLALWRRRLLAREHEALHDPLTGLLNRSAVRERIRHLVPAPQAADGRRAAMMVLDLDSFKAVNDTLGHPAGDMLLTQVADRLRASIRPIDVVARLGGDEFAVLLTQLPDAAKAGEIATQLLDRLRTGLYTVHGIELTVDASVGIALIPEHGDDADLLLQRADVAMYQAKSSRAGIVVYDEATDLHDVAELGLLAELRRAIDADELVLHYQPKARLATGDIVGVEALVRWQHPVRGLLGPAAFIPLAENTALMAPLTEWVLRRAIEHATRWRDRGLVLPVAVNVSPRSLLEGDLAGTLLRLLANAGLSSDLLEIEITETAIMADPDGAVRMLRQLQAMGIRVSIDDFGTGYTSLSYLKQLPVQTLKIDRAFVAGILENDQDQAITESIIGLGHKLGLSVIAEGIENDDVWQRLRSLNCDEGQGYHLARPMPSPDLKRWMTAREAAHPTSVG